MRTRVKIRGKEKVIETSVADGRRRLTVDGRPLDADLAAISPGLYSILLAGSSFEAYVRDNPGGDVVVLIDGEEFLCRVEDPREWRHAGAALEAEGRQHVRASMPGKVVRLLVKAGQAVGAGQGLVVIEAMKMQNEVRAPKSGTIESLLVTEGQAVNGGEILAIVS